MNNRCGTIEIHKNAVMAALREAIIVELEMETETLLTIMRREIQNTTHGSAPGKPEWRDSLSAELDEVYRVIADGVIEFGVGLPYATFADAGYQFIRAMLVAYGSGDKAGGAPIQARPGELVWDDDLLDFHPSGALAPYLLPEEFNQEGNDFIRSSMRLMKAHFEAMLSSLSGKIPHGLFANATRETGR